jgi:hypothetical protein
MRPSGTQVASDVARRERERPVTVIPWGDGKSLHLHWHAGAHRAAGATGLEFDPALGITLSYLNGNFLLLQRMRPRGGDEDKADCEQKQECPVPCRELDFLSHDCYLLSSSLYVFWLQ